MLTMTSGQSGRVRGQTRAAIHCMQPASVWADHSVSLHARWNATSRDVARTLAPRCGRSTNCCFIRWNSSTLSNHNLKALIACLCQLLCQRITLHAGILFTSAPLKHCNTCNVATFCPSCSLSCRSAYNNFADVVCFTDILPIDSAAIRQDQSVHYKFRLVLYRIIGFSGIVLTAVTE